MTIRIAAYLSLVVLLIPFRTANAAEPTIELYPLTANCDWAVAVDGSGVVLSSLNGDVADFFVAISSDHGVTTSLVSISDNDSFIDQEGDAGVQLAAPFVIQRGDEVAFALAVTNTSSNGAFTSSWASRSWLDDYSNWFNSTFGGGWSEAAGGVIHTGLTSVIDEETLANTSDGAILTGTIIVSVPVAVGTVYGGEVLLGVGTFGGTATVATTVEAVTAFGGLAAFSRLIGMGVGRVAALARAGNITLAEIQAAGITLPIARYWRNFYQAAVDAERGAETAAARVQLFERIIEFLGG